MKAICLESVLIRAWEPWILRGEARPHSFGLARGRDLLALTIPTSPQGYAQSELCAGPSRSAETLPVGLDQIESVAAPVLGERPGGAEAGGATRPRTLSILVTRVSSIQRWIIPALSGPPAKTGVLLAITM